jgi:hypothetical protein
MEQIIKRGIKKEQSAEKYMKSVKFENKEKKEKKDERRRTAIDKVRMDYISHTNKGMDYYRNVLSETEGRIQQKMDKERAKSATVYNHIRYNAEIYSTGGNIGQFNRLKNLSIQSPSND